MKFFLFLILFLQCSFAQQKYLVYFADKGPSAGILAKGTPSYEAALAGLSERSIERREKSMGNNIITFEDIPVYKPYIELLSNKGIKIINTLKWFNAVSAELTDKQLSEITGLPFVEKAEPVKVLKYKEPETQRILGKENIVDSALYGRSFTQLRLSEIPPAHNKGITGKGVLLGVMDTGFRWKTHEALSNADVLGEYDFIFNDEITENENDDSPGQHNHGTSVFSVIAGYKDSILIGAAYDAQFLLAKTEDIRSETRVEEDNYAAALEWMENLGVDITTSSLGYSVLDDFQYTYEDMDGRTTIVTKAAEIAFSKGVLVITSAGNEGDKNWYYITAPADGINTIAVGAVNAKNQLAAFSGRGPTYDGRIKPEILAMGVSVYGASAFQDDAYGTSSGTSLSAPVAAGVSVLLLSAHPYLTNVQMRDILLRTSDNHIRPDNDRGYGLVSAKKAIEYPNLGYNNGSYVLNKIFLDDNVEDVRLYLSQDTMNFTEASLYGDSIHYSYILPSEFSNRVVRFYYEYSGSSGENIRVPATGSYSMLYGDLTSVREENDTPVDFILSNNYPNPFNSTTRIDFFVRENSNVDLTVYNTLGEKVRTLYNSAAGVGEYSISWDGRTDDGRICASGVYIYRLRIKENEISKKMVLLK